MQISELGPYILITLQSRCDLVMFQNLVGKVKSNSSFRVDSERSTTGFLLVRTNHLELRSNNQQHSV